MPGIIDVPGSVGGHGSVLQLITEVNNKRTKMMRRRMKCGKVYNKPIFNYTAILLFYTQLKAMDLEDKIGETSSYVIYRRDWNFNDIYTLYNLYFCT